MQPATDQGDQDEGGDFLPTQEVNAFDGRALGRYLATIGLDFDPAQPIRQFAGGLANRNYLILVDGELVVLRRPPEGDLPPGAHDMAREHRVLSGLSECLPYIPKSLHYCPDPAVLGVPFQIVEYRSGLVVRDALPAERPDIDVPARLSQVMVDTLAEIHSVRPEACGLSELGRPQGFLQRAVAGWTKRGRLVASNDTSLAIVEHLGEWLNRCPLRDEPHSLVHLDFKLDNMILDPDDYTPRAVVDWDMGTLGSALYDFSTLLSYWSEIGDPPELIGPVMMPTDHAGCWTRAQAVERYATLTGCDPAELVDLRILALFRLAVVYLQLHRQWIGGAVKSPRYAGFKERGEQLLIHVWDLARECGR